MTTAFWLLLISLGVVAYGWVGYPLLILALRSSFARRGNRTERSMDPFVSVIIPVHNEALRIALKLENCLELLYPNDRMEILVVSDGSTDRTEEIVRGFMVHDSRILWLQSNSRAGKSSAQNLAAARARGDIFFFTDANTATAPNILRTIIDDLTDPTVGLVTAAVHFGRPEDAVEKGQGLYWRYELFLRSVESDLGILATGSGQALAVRRELFRSLPARYGDDCIMPLDVRLQGFKVIQDREATVYDELPHSIEGELRARIRMTARNWSGTLSRPALLNPLRFPLTALGLVSHRLLRWLTPFFLAIVLLSNACLALEGRAILLWWLQVGFYLSAFVGWELSRKQRPAWVFGYPFSFCLANVGFMLGMVKAFRNQKIVTY